ncbi:hypothetical protein PR003_g20532 [Phytophthora rubi]|uniref:Uncharacterized protein n=1 Tax=Phytophthora rubi TaxID=129364 RepID=A0A6A4DNC7_9STRA|nr:hypothetical protein PR002_g20243 [Phytophthora rubi]KAE9309371.1 hypothetical protein PR003_g20532 [Phytophthora rubi]
MHRRPATKGGGGSTRWLVLVPQTLLHEPTTLCLQNAPELSTESNIANVRPVDSSQVGGGWVSGRRVRGAAVEQYLHRERKLQELQGKPSIANVRPADAADVYGVLALDCFRGVRWSF